MCLKFRKQMIPLFLILFLIIGSSILASGVDPLLLNLSGKPGETLNFKVTIQPSDKPGDVQLSLHKIVQKPDGNFDYQPVDPGSYAPTGWVSFPSKVTVVPGKSTEIKGTIKLPNDAKGSDNHLLLMIEPENDIKKVDGLSLMVRYGVTLNVQVDKPGTRPAATITSFDMVKSQKGFATIQGNVKNTSLVDLQTYAYVTIRNVQKKLMEKIELLPYSYLESNVGDPVLYPDSELLYLGVVHQNLPPGAYEIRLFLRYGETGQLIQSKNINIQEGQYKFPEAMYKNIKIGPEELSFEGKPGQISIKALKFENKSDKPLIVQMVTSDIEPKYTYSVFNNTKFETKNGDKFVIKPKQMVVKIITVAFPKDAPIRGSYGNLKIQVYTEAEKPIFVEEQNIKVSANIVGEKKKQVEVKNLSGERNGENYIMSAVIKNTGNTAISPAITLLLKDDDNRTVANTDLNCDGEENITILPDRMATVTATLTNIKPGKYQAEVKAVDGSAILDKKLFTVQVQ